MHRVALLLKIEVCCSEILHEDLVFQRSVASILSLSDCKKNREICPGLTHRSLLPHNEGFCPSGRGRDTQRGVYFQCSLHHALSDPMSATASSRTPPFWAKNSSPLTIALSQQNAPFNGKKGKFGKKFSKRGQPMVNQKLNSCPASTITMKNPIL